MTNRERTDSIFNDLGSAHEAQFLLEPNSGFPH